MDGRCVGTIGFIGALFGVVLATPVMAAEPPPLVAAYAQQLVRQCGGELTPTLASQVLRQVDLNGDKLEDWVVDASSYPCPTRPAAFADAGTAVTVFLTRPDGRALPALQRQAFGAHLEGKPESGVFLVLTLGGRDCGEDSPKARCDQRVVWRAKEQRLEVVAASAKPAAAKIPPAKAR